MNKKVATVGLLAGGIALAGLTGSAYAEGSGAAGKPVTPVKGHGPIVVICAGTAVKGKAGEKGTVRIPEKAKLPTLVKRLDGKPVFTADDGKVPGGKPVTVVRDKDGHTTVAIGKPPKGLPLPPKGVPGKGVKCTTVKPGTPGAPPAASTR